MTKLLQVPRINSQVAQISNVNTKTCLEKIIRTINIVATEAYTTIRYVLPAAMTWIYRKYLWNQIKTIEITAKKTKQVAYLHIHGELSKSQNACSVLLSHGDYSHPYTMLPLADIVTTRGMPTFSLYVPKIQNNKDFTIHDELFERAINTIQKLVKKENKTNFILAGGHSKGAIHLCHRQFVKLDPRIKPLQDV
jgi:hypothetical protein